MARLLIVQDPDSLRLLLQPGSDFPPHQVALVVVDNETCEHDARQSGGPRTGALSDCAVYRHVARQDVTEWVPARVAITGDGRRYLREDVVCFNICAAAAQRTPEAAVRGGTNTERATETILRASGVELNLLSHRIHRRGREVHVGPTEYRLLHVLLQSPDRVFTRAQLLAAVWGRQSSIDERTVDVHIGRLRKALKQPREGDPIRTVRGIGYAFDAGGLPCPTTHEALLLDEQRGAKSC